MLVPRFVGISFDRRNMTKKKRKKQKEVFALVANVIPSWSVSS